MTGSQNDDDEDAVEPDKSIVAEVDDEQDIGEARARKHRM
jgi:hypothetical protein